jgi:integrase
LTASRTAGGCVSGEADEVAVRRDLPDLTRWFLATGVCIGEAIAVAWENIDLDNELVNIDEHVKGSA